jgi:cell division protein FtsB
MVRGTVGQPAADEPRRRSRFTGRAAVLLLVLLVLVISYASSLRAWLEQRAEIAATRAEIAQAQANVDALERERLRWQDPAYVRQQARERFGWVLPGEVLYRVIGVDGETLGAPAPPAVPAAEPPADWYEGVWDSIQQAGEVPEPSTAPPPRRDVITPPERNRPPHR